MAYRQTVSARAVREIGEAFERYEEQVPGLGHDFIEALEAKFEFIVRSPQLYAETQRAVGRGVSRTDLRSACACAEIVGALALRRRSQIVR